MNVLFEELFKDVNHKRDRDAFIEALKIMEENGLYDYINNEYTESAKMDTISFIANKAKIVGESALWRGKQKLFLSKSKTKDYNNDPNFTNFTNQPIELYCGEWIANDNCIYKERGGEQLVASYQPILITKRYINIESSTEKFELSYFDENRWKTKIVSRETISSSSSITKLVNYGIDVASDTAYHLCSYLNKLYTLNKDVIPVVNSISRLGWVDDNFQDFLPYTNSEIVCDLEGEGKELVNSVSEKGNFDTWLKLANKVRAKESILRVVMASSFASPLISVLNTLGFITHIYGDRGAGKTLSLMLATSVWGNPTQGKLFNTINNTLFAIEGRAEILQNIAFSGDELHNLKMKDVNYDEFIYMIANGQGKGRGGKDLTLQKSKTWKLVAITTGEDKITKENSHSGSKVRVVEIESNRNLFKNIAGREVAEVLKNNYGFAGKMFIQKIIELGPDKLREMYNEVETEFLTDFIHVIDSKQMNAIVTIMLADRIAVDTIFKDGVYLKASDFKEIIKEESEISVAERAMNYIRDTISVNKNKFEKPSDMFPTSYNEFWGEMQVDCTIINKQILKRELQKEGYSLSEVISKWADKGYIQVYGDRFHYWNEKLKANCVKIFNNVAQVVPF